MVSGVMGECEVVGRVVEAELRGGRDEREGRLVGFSVLTGVCGGRGFVGSQQRPELSVSLAALQSGDVWRGTAEVTRDRDVLRHLGATWPLYHIAELSYQVEHLKPSLTVTTLT